MRMYAVRAIGDATFKRIHVGDLHGRGEIVDGVKDRVIDRQLDDRTIREYPLHADLEPGPFHRAEEAVA